MWVQSDLCRYACISTVIIFRINSTEYIDYIILLCLPLHPSNTLTRQLKQLIPSPSNLQRALPNAASLVGSPISKTTRSNHYYRTCPNHPLFPNASPFSWNRVKDTDMFYRAQRKLLYFNDSSSASTSHSAILGSRSTKEIVPSQPTASLNSPAVSSK